MISIPESLSFAKLVMMSFAPAKSAGGAKNASQDPFIQSPLSCFKKAAHSVPKTSAIKYN